MSQPTPFESTACRVPNIDELGFDPQALRRKYDAERNRRVRAESVAQYKDIEVAILGDGVLRHVARVASYR